MLASIATFTKQNALPLRAPHEPAKVGTGVVDFLTLQSGYHIKLYKHSPGMSMLEDFQF